MVFFISADVLAHVGKTMELNVNNSFGFWEVRGSSDLDGSSSTGDCFKDGISWTATGSSESVLINSFGVGRGVFVSWCMAILGCSCVFFTVFSLGVTSFLEGSSVATLGEIGADAGLEESIEYHVAREIPITKAAPGRPHFLKGLDFGGSCLSRRFESDSQAAGS